MTPYNYGREHASKSFGLVVEWTRALSGKSDLCAFLDRLMSLIKADAALISRVSTAEKAVRYIARCDRQSGKVWPAQPRTFANALIGEWLPAVKQGSIWKLSDHFECNTHMKSVEGIDGSIIELIVCPLENSNGHADILELHFRSRPAQHDLDLATIMLGTLASSWNDRVSGLVARTLAKNRKYVVIKNEDIPILDIENPAQLSRSEFRVCALLKDGMTVSVIAETLSIAPATVRAHLSSAFAKTGTSNQVELLHQLNRSKPTVGKVASG